MSNFPVKPSTLKMENGGPDLNKAVASSSSSEQEGYTRFHHSSTGLPVHVRHLEVDSESDGENNPDLEEWQRTKATRIIDEFTDVNKGEKEFMKMWNLHVLKYKRYTGDCQLPLVCELFVQERGDELILKNLINNFGLHLTNLYDFGILTFEGVHAIFQPLIKVMPELVPKADIRNVMEIQEDRGCSNWRKVGNIVGSYVSLFKRNGAWNTSNFGS
ncbi:unnamed protein product [Orchesella dallaii]|uniref:Polycomb protein VEFS-Box domain-containing protein n=1 Tax=Orchesella dallaii TaxID=48710 RepID=A0ABP1RRY9_9HEXA